MALDIPQKNTGDALTADEFNQVNDAIVQLQNELIEVRGITGGADYSDTQYTEGSPFLITAGVENKTNMPNNAGNVYDTQKPTYITTFYDNVTGKILGRNGDFLSLNIELTARPTTNATNVRLRISIDIGGVPGEIYPDERILTRGVGVAQNILFPLPVIYTRDTFETNGGIVKVWSENSNVEIYNIRFVFANHHKAR